MRTVWITGALGFTGRHLVKHLREQSESLRLVGLDVATLPTGSAPSDADLDVYEQIDLLDAAQLQVLASTEPPALIFHLAGLMAPHTLERLRSVNVEGSRQLLTALAKANCQNARVISIGSAAEYSAVTASPLAETAPAGGDNDYGVSKSEQTQLLLEQGPRQGLSVVIARPFNIIGPGLSEQLVAGRICRSALASDNGTIELKGSISAQRDFIDIRDVVSAYWVLANAANASGIYNVCSGQGTRIDALVALFGAAMEQAFSVDAPPQEDFAESIVIGDPSRLQSLGWQPEVPLAQSVADMIHARRQAVAG